jgi:hypothetical protein
MFIQEKETIMKDFVENYKDIRICAHAYSDWSGCKTLAECDRVSLRFAVPCGNGEWYTITTYTHMGELSAARVFCHDRVTATEKVVETPAELAEFINGIKPKDAPSIVLEETGHSFARWAKVSPKGTIGVHYHQCASSYEKEIPLPQDGEIVYDASKDWNGSEYRCNVFWNGADAAKSLWDNALNNLKRLQDFCKREKEKEDKELAVGATRIEALLKFQNNAKTIEEKISEKWNSMSTEDKAKALKIGKTAKKK